MARILIVDDDPIVIRVVRLALEREGYTVNACSNGHEALEEVGNCPPDALITDIEMPQMTGEELCMEIHRLMPDYEFPIFIVTSLTAIEHRRWSRSLPNLHFLEKPISARQLVSRLAASLEQSATGSAAC
jgi:CheY-like chemotaxis protein